MKKRKSTHSKSSNSLRNPPFFLTALLITVAGLIVYANSFFTPFIFDDTNHISYNPRIQQLWPLTQVIANTNRPVVDLSLAINYAFGGLQPFGYHLINWIVHILAAIVLAAIVRRTLCNSIFPQRYQELSGWFALVVAVIWMVHPLQTQSVTYTIQRAESMMGLFFLLTLYSVIRSADGLKRWEGAALVFCALGMGCKEVMVTAPLIVAIYDRIFLAKIWKEVIAQRGWMYVGLAATWLFLWQLVHTVRDNSANAGWHFAGASPFSYALTQTKVIAHYLKLSFAPRHLCLDYDESMMTSVGEGILFVVMIGIFLSGTLWALWKNPPLGFLGIWFLLILSPTSSFFPIGDMIVEHRMYLPLAAIVVLAVVIGDFGLQKLQMSKTLRANCARGIVIALVIALGWRTIQRNRDYRSETAMWANVVAQSPDNARARLNLGNALAKEKQWDSAIEQYRQGFKLNPAYEKIPYNLALSLAQTGKWLEAQQMLEKAIQLKPDFMEAYNELGDLLTQQKKWDEAKRWFRQLIDTYPQKPEGYAYMGFVFSQEGKISEAINFYEQALKISPEYFPAHYNLALAMAEHGDIDRAIEEFSAVVKIQPKHVTANFNLGNMFAQKGDIKKAIGYYTETVRLNPQFSEARQRLETAHLVAQQLGLE